MAPAGSESRGCTVRSSGSWHGAYIEAVQIPCTWSCFAGMAKDFVGRNVLSGSFCLHCPGCWPLCFLIYGKIEKCFLSPCSPEPQVQACSVLGRSPVPIWCTACSSGWGGACGCGPCPVSVRGAAGVPVVVQSGALWGRAFQNGALAAPRGGNGIGLKRIVFTVCCKFFLRMAPLLLNRQPSFDLQRCESDSRVQRQVLRQYRFS